MRLCLLDAQAGFTPVENKEGGSIRGAESSEWSCLICKHEGCPAKATYQGAADRKAGKGPSYRSQSMEGQGAGLESRFHGNLWLSGACRAGSRADGGSRGSRRRKRGDLKGTEDGGLPRWVNKGRPKTGRLSGQAAPAGPSQRCTWMLQLPSVQPRPLQAASGRRNLRNFLAQPDSATLTMYALLA